jgi:hypothetical protein
MNARVTKMLNAGTKSNMAGAVINGKYLNAEGVRREEDKLKADAARFGWIDKSRECIWHTPKILREMLETIESGKDVDRECLHCYGFDAECEYYKARGKI